MQSTFATPQIFVSGRILNAVGFDADELFVKYEILLGTNFKLIDGKIKGETFQCASNEEMSINIINFDHPIYFNTSCRSIKGWPKIVVEVWANDSDNRNSIVGYGSGFVPFKAGNSRMTINCWRPLEGTNIGLGEYFLGNNAEFINKSAIYSSDEKFEIYSASTGQVNIEIDVIFKDFHLHGIKIN